MTVYRVYFNTRKELQWWSVDEGNPATEITVVGVRFLGVNAIAVSQPNMSTQPRAWFEVQGKLTISHGEAIFTPEHITLA